MQIREHAAANPDKPAIIIHPSGTVLTFAELEARANRLAHFFREHGLREGDAVAILMENNEHYHAVMWAARRCGLYYVPINTHLTAAEAAYIIDNSSAKAIVGSAALRKTCENLGEHTVPEACRACPIADDDLDGWHRYPECVADQPDTPIDDEIEGDLLQYSSGTTGRPKGIKRELPHLPPAEVPGLMSGAGRLLAGSRGRLPQPRPAVPHRAVGVVDADSGRRHHDRRAWRSSTPRAASTRSSGTASPTASSCR